MKTAPQNTHTPCTAHNTVTRLHSSTVKETPSSSSISSSSSSAAAAAAAETEHGESTPLTGKGSEVHYNK